VDACNRRATGPFRSRERLWLLHVVACSLLALAQAVLLGCNWCPAAAPPMDMTVSLDREQYDIGQPLVATVRLENHARRQMDVPRFDQRALRFFYMASELGAPLLREPVHSLALQDDPRHIAPGETTERRFLFTRVTEEPGQFLLAVSFKGAVLKGKLLEQEIFAKPVKYRVTERVALRRDSVSGLVLKTQAAELACRHAAGKATASRVVLVPLGETGVYTWVVLLHVEEPGRQARSCAVQVNPYTGRVDTLEMSSGELAALEASAAQSPAGGDGISPRRPQAQEDGK